MTHSPEQIPGWAKERACDLANDVAEEHGMLRAYEPKFIDAGTNCAAVAFARYIAAHEEPPVDPLLIEARGIVETTIHWSPQTDRDLQSGKNDNTPEVKIALAALRRGIELAGDRQADWMLRNAAKGGEQ